MADEQQGQQDQRDADSQQDQHQDDIHESDDLGDKGKEAIRREREARKAAERERADLAKRVAEFEKAQREAEEASAKEKGEWEKIAQQRADELNDLRDKLAAREKSDMRREVAKKAGLPDDLIEFVRGDTQDEMDAAAKELAKHLKPVDAIDNDAGNRGQGINKRRANDTPSYQFGKRPI